MATPAAPVAVGNAGTKAGCVGRTSWREDVATALFAAWTVGGLYLDGWAHNNRPKLETFFTPWHAVFYSGALALTLWLAHVFRAHRRAGVWLWQGAPAGYAPALAGGVLFAAGAAGDLLWHSVFGVERDIAALLSPTHLLLLTGGALATASPLRASLASNRPGPSPSLRELLPVLLSLIELTLLAAFFFQYLSAFQSRAPVLQQRTFSPLANALAHEQQARGIATIVLTNLIVLAPLLLLLRRWRPPLGSATLLFGTVALLVGSLYELRLWPVVISAALAGAAVDLLCRRLRVAPSRPGRQRLLAGLAPLLLWSGHMLALEIACRVTWNVELWAGVIVMTVLSGLVLSYLVSPNAGTIGSSEAGLGAVT